MTTNPQRYRHRSEEVEAIQWTGSNAAALRAFAGADFDEIELDDRVDDPEETAAVREADHGTWRGLKAGDWVVRLDGGLYEFSGADFAKQYEAAPTPPSADQAALVEIAAQAIRDSNGAPEALEWWRAHPQLIPAHVYAAAVLAVLPPSAGQAAVEAPLSPYYEHPACGFHWHGRDGMDVPLRDGEPVCPRCELARAKTTVDLLRRTEAYLSALHGPVARHDNLATNLGCAGCELRDKIRNELAAVDWTDGHSQLEAIAAAVWEQCGRSDNGSCVEDDPRNIAVAALAAVVPPPADSAAEEAYRLAVSAALRLGTGANWEAIRDRAEDLTAEVRQLTEAGRRLLEQRQEMAAERFAWQERGDRAEARVRQMEAAASVDPAALSIAQREMLSYALDLVEQRDFSRSGRLTDDDRIVLAELRRMAVEAQQQTEPPCCSDPTCACVQVNAAGRCDCARWDDAPLPIRYRNWRGETADRRILPIRVWFGATDWHPEPQWFLRAVDVDRGVERDFALADMQGLPAVVPGGAGEEPAHETLRQCPALDIAYGRCIRPVHLNDDECFHADQPIRIDEETDEDTLCGSEYPGDDNFVGQLCGLPKDHFGDHRCDEPISAGYTAKLRWAAVSQPGKEPRP